MKILGKTDDGVQVKHKKVVSYFMTQNTFIELQNLKSKSPFYGAQTTLYCALDDAIECESGMYYSDCARKNPSNGALNKEDQKRLWDISEEMVGIKSSN